MQKPMYESLRITSPIEPYLCARNAFSLEAGDSIELSFMFGAAFSFEKAKHDAKGHAASAFTQQKSLAFAMETSALHFMGISAGKAQLYDKLALRLILDIKSKPPVASNNCFDISRLYKYSISGKLPIVLVEITNPTQYRLLKTLLQALRYITYKGEEFELVILGRYKMSYRCDVRSYINEVVATFRLSFGEKANKYVHVIDGFDISDNEYALLLRCASIIIDGSRTIDRQFQDEKAIPALLPEYRQAEQKPDDEAHENAENRLFAYNGIGGFDTQNDEYVIHLRSYEDTPLPWSNIICNPQNEGMGTLVTESGGGYTWKNNCHSMRITPWHNDAVHDTPCETVLIRDDENNIRTICHSRIQGSGTVTVRHGLGYSVFENKDALCNCTMTVFTDTKAPQKISSIELCNNTSHKKHLCIDFSVDFEKQCGAETVFEDGIVYQTSAESGEARYMTAKNADRLKFSGDRMGVMQFLTEKSNRTCDSFACLSCELTIEPYEKRELILLLGMDEERNIKSNISSITAQSALEKLHDIKRAWQKNLTHITVSTPDKSFDTLVNKRLLYQVYASRLMGRTGFYQSGGAIGFRDQLQDMLALLYSDTERVKGHILLCSSMQYEAGDVLHWWHRPMSGVRTHITDDRLFLPLVCSAYAKHTGDTSIFTVRTPFLKDIAINDGADDIYYKAEHSSISASVYEHCVRAIKSAAKTGQHGLPLMGSGDWNDGMNNVGRNGGESVFLAFLLIYVIDQMIPTVKHMRDSETMESFFEIKANLQRSIDEFAWDGDRFLRAYYGDGVPLGEKTNEQCKIDLLTQVWAVFSQRNRDPEKCETALNTAKELLYDKQLGIIKLLTPAFSDTDKEHNAGYIESYINGVRENGGQYTHAAVWYLIATCLMGYDDETLTVFSDLNPIKKGEDIKRYKAEPYAVCADVYSCTGQEGRCGWTWYTGSASLMYTAAIKYMLGICREGNILKIKPHNTWKSYDVKMCYESSVYNIHVQRSDCASISVDSFQTSVIELTDDGKEHTVCVTYKA